MRNSNEKGSALVLVVVASIFLIILTGAAYTYFSNNVDTQIWARDRIQARLSAEAGVNLATHMLIAGEALPVNTDPQDFIGTYSSSVALPGDLGDVYVSVDGNENNTKITSANAYRIRCLATIPGNTIETYGMEGIVMPQNLARFSVFMNNPSTGGFYGDGYRFDGPFYANGPICVFSSSSGSEFDPFFYSFHLTSDYYIYGQNSGGSHETTPTAGNLEMQPYNRLSMGSPYFELGVDPIPFGPSELNWQGVKNAATSGGLVLNEADGDIENGSRLSLRGDSTLIVRVSAGATPDTFDLADYDNPVVWIENDPNHRVYLNGWETSPMDMALTIGMYGSLYMSGDLMYENNDLEDPTNEQLLGIMTVYGDVVIADDPEGLEAGWEGFQIVTDDDFEYDAVLVALDGELRAENYWKPAMQAEFLLLGGYMIDSEGITGTTNPTGFDISVYFDPRLLTMHPPYFPTTANWLNIMWADKPDLSASQVQSGIPIY